MTKPVLTVTLRHTIAGLLGSGVSEDEDIFRNVYFASLNEATTYLQRRYQHMYRLVLNLPPTVERNP
jgi:hypothetical protein